MMFKELNEVDVGGCEI